MSGIEKVFIRLDEIKLDRGNPPETHIIENTNNKPKNISRFFDLFGISYEYNQGNENDRIPEIKGFIVNFQQLIYVLYSQGSQPIRNFRFEKIESMLEMIHGYGGKIILPLKRFIQENKEYNYRDDKTFFNYPRFVKNSFEFIEKANMFSSWDNNEEDVFPERLLTVVNGNPSIRKYIRSVHQFELQIIQYGQNAKEEEKIFPDIKLPQTLLKTQIPLTGYAFSPNATADIDIVDEDSGITIAQWSENRLFILVPFFFRVPNLFDIEDSVFRENVTRFADILLKKCFSEYLEHYYKNLFEKKVLIKQEQIPDMLSYMIEQERIQIEHDKKTLDEVLLDLYHKVAVNEKAKYTAQEKLKSFSLMDKNYKERALEEFNRMEDINGVKRIFMKRNSQILTIITHNLYCQETIDGDWYDIGEFEITIDLAADNPQNAIIWKNLTRKGPGDCEAPHVDNNGVACVGNFSMIVAKPFAEKRISVLIEMAIKFIQSVNVDDEWGERIYHFPLIDEETVIKETKKWYDKEDISEENLLQYNVKRKRKRPEKQAVDEIATVQHLVLGAQ